jgi:hypothetical protein
MKNIKIREIQKEVRLIEKVELMKFPNKNLIIRNLTAKLNLMSWIWIKIFVT